MIARSPVYEELSDWQAELRMAYRDPRQLLRDLGHDPASFALPARAATGFAFRVTRPFAARMRPHDRDDPLLRQVLPDQAELRVTPGFHDDPVGEFQLGRDHGLLQKYAGRALLTLTGGCAINCRYCFRRAYPYAETSGRVALTAALATIAAQPTLSEVILSGGDPLILDDAALASLFERLAAIPHVRRLRIHSRVPVVLPQRMSTALLDLFSTARFAVVLVIHANHAQEIDRPTARALTRCRAAGLTVLNQSVLLRGVNDSAAILAELSEALFAAGVLPYYLHLLDKVSGTAHFDSSDADARTIERELRGLLPGYLVPRFVREVAGAASKLPLGDEDAPFSEIHPGTPH